MPNRRDRGSLSYSVAYVFAAAAGATGVLASPSTSVAEFFNGRASWALYVWSGLFLLAAVGALVSRARERYFAETVAVEVLAAVFALWAIMVLFIGSSSSTQAALAFAACSAFMHGWAQGRRYRVMHEAARVARALVQEARLNEGDAL